jgi:isopropylmalate/homocitrate/citramalate synthase
MSDAARRVTLRDSTLREAMDTPRVDFSVEQRLRIARHLVRAGVAEAEVAAPSRVAQDLAFVRRLREEKVALRTSGLVYAGGADRGREVEAAAPWLDHIDLLVPVSPERAPHDAAEKVRLIRAALAHATAVHADTGAGFPHSTQCDPEFLAEIAAAAAESGARRIIVYDTHGGGNPFAVRDLVALVRARVPGIPVFFHGHNDLGLATANTLAAVAAGADGADVTVNGLGDRAGNASLEQVAMALHLGGVATGIRLAELRALSEAVAHESGVAVPPLAPVVGEFVLWHKSPSHLHKPGLFEAFDPALILGNRKLDGS